MKRRLLEVVCKSPLTPLLPKEGQIKRQAPVKAGRPKAWQSSPFGKGGLRGIFPIKRNIVNTLLMLFLGLGLSHSVLAADNAFFGWYGLSAKGKLGFLSPSLKNFSWNVLNQARFSHNPQPQFGNTSNKLTENLLFIQFNYHINDQLHVGLGYTRDWLDTFNENRSYEEIGWHSKLADWGKLTTRTRFEQRVNDNAKNRNVGWRIREFVQWSHPIPGLPKVSLKIFDEVMWYLNSSTWRSDGFTENRAFAGISLPVSPSNDVTIGYLNQFVRKGTSKESQLNHALFFNLGFHF